MTDRDKDKIGSKTDESEAAHGYAGGDDLVALLYDELDDASAERLTSDMERDGELRDAHDGLADIRDLFSQLPDEEPPARLSAQLLAEAARAPHVAKAKAGPVGDGGQGLWQRFVAWCQPLVAKPAFAAAASLVLVAGIAGVLYVKKGDELTETRRHEAEKVDVAPPTLEANRAERGPADEPADPGDVVIGGADEAEPEAPAAASETAPSEGGKREADTSAERRRAPRKKASAKSSAPNKSALGATGDDAYGGRAQAILGLSEETLAPTEPSADAPGRSAGSGSGADGRRDYAAPPQSAPEPQPEAKVQQKARPLTVTEMHSRAVDAAQSGDCAQVNRLLGEIRSRDSEYYKNRVASDKRLATCRGKSKP